MELKDTHILRRSKNVSNRIATMRKEMLVGDSISFLAADSY